MTQTERRVYLIHYLLAERGETAEIPHDEYNQKRLLRSLFNVRLPAPIGEDFLRVQDEYLQEEAIHKSVTDIADLEPIRKGIYLWQGDITTLRCDAIVNAANSQMLGCFYPCHGCIDNAIHTYAGVQLRNACYEFMKVQGHEEPTGQAKITPAYNLPCQYVIHTVGPIVGGRLTENDCELLRSCYLSCLNVAVKNSLKSIAFCCISTGVFGFPQKEAAQIAVDTVKEYQKQHEIEVIFNVFKNDDYELYREFLSADRTNQE
ncbi:MAG: protein-ADP-ribose hydrolase [Ruminococcus sp.]|nr:protein-ADP-ribose hydrolase [Ruminococcus sp.]